METRQMAPFLYLLQEYSNGGLTALPSPLPAAAKFASQGDAHMRTNTQIKFLYYPLPMSLPMSKILRNIS